MIEEMDMFEVSEIHHYYDLLSDLLEHDKNVQLTRNGKVIALIVPVSYYDPEALNWAVGFGKSVLDSDNYY